MEQLIEYQKGTVLFPQYADYLKLARDVATVLDGMEPTEDNIRDVKQSLADARKIVDALNQRRIEVKKAMLEPYSVLESQVKMISSVIDEADGKLRSKVREMEEQEREQKRQALKKFWDERQWLYKFPVYIPDAFDRWLTPQHLNKTASEYASEKAMTAWMEQRDMEITSILSMDNHVAIMEEYVQTQDLPGAITKAKAREERVSKIKAAAPKEKETATFIVTGQKDIQITELLLRDHNIDYKKV